MGTDWTDYYMKQQETVRKSREAMEAIASKLEKNPHCTGYSTAYFWAKFDTEDAAAEFKKQFPKWDVEVGKRLVVRDE